jgi:CDP-diacylglycerol--glycerol-3-phosphate 3-phosphatidyltransferase
MPLNIPNILTLARIFLIPVFVGIYYLPIHFVDAHQQNVIATSIFVIAAVTDWFDGLLARKLNQMSAFGAFLDPVADKLMVGAALFVLVKLGRADASIAMIIVGREIGISALREWMAKLGASGSVAVSSLGKWKTTFQMVAIPVLLVQSTGIMITIGTVLLNLAALLTIVSMVKYFQAAWPEIKAKAHQHDGIAIRKPTVPMGAVKA